MLMLMLRKRNFSMDTAADCSIRSSTQSVALVSLRRQSQPASAEQRSCRYSKWRRLDNMRRTTWGASCTPRRLRERLYSSTAARAWCEARNRGMEQTCGWVGGWWSIEGTYRFALGRRTSSAKDRLCILFIYLFIYLLCIIWSMSIVRNNILRDKNGTTKSKLFFLQRHSFETYLNSVFKCYISPTPVSVIWQLLALIVSAVLLSFRLCYSFY